MNIGIWQQIIYKGWYPIKCILPTLSNNIDSKLGSFKKEMLSKDCMIVIALGSKSRE